MKSMDSLAAVLVLSHFVWTPSSVQAVNETALAASTDTSTADCVGTPFPCEAFGFKNLCGGTSGDDSVFEQL